MTTVAEAANVRPPHGAGTTEPGVPSKVTVDGTSTTAQDTGVDVNDVGTWVTFCCDVAFHIRFGGTSSVGASTTDDYRIPADQERHYFVTPRDRYFRAIRAGAVSGTLRWYISGGTR